MRDATRSAASVCIGGVTVRVDLSGDVGAGVVQALRHDLDVDPTLLGQRCPGVTFCLAREGPFIDEVVMQYSDRVVAVSASNLPGASAHDIVAEMAAEVARPARP